MNKYRRIPGEPIEAKQWHLNDGEAFSIAEWPMVQYDYGTGSCFIETMFSDQRVYLQNGDWILPEPDGVHFYPCKPEVFAKTYEPVIEDHREENWKIMAPFVAGDEQIAKSMYDAFLTGTGYLRVDPKDIFDIGGAESSLVEQETDEFLRGSYWTPEQQKQFRRLAKLRDTSKAEKRDIPAPPAEVEEQYDEMRVRPGMRVISDFGPEVVSDVYTSPTAPISTDDPAHPRRRYARFQEIITGAINGCSMENGSDTPDFLLARFLTEQLEAFDRLMRARDEWYGGSHREFKAQLEAEGAHTAAGQAEIERLQALLNDYQERDQRG